MIWRRKVDKPLSELMLTQFSDAYMGNWGGGGGGVVLSWFNLIHAYSNYSGIKHLTGFIPFLTTIYCEKFVLPSYKKMHIIVRRGF